MASDKQAKAVLIDHEMEARKEVLIVNWNLGNQCNFRCRYCVDVLNSGSHRWVEAGIVTRFADALIEHYGKQFNKKLLFEFTGGEVTLYKDLYAVLNYLKDKGCQTEILSNASPKLSYWEKLKNVLDSIILSYHAEHCSSEHFFTIVQYLQTHIHVHVNIMMDPLFFQRCRELGERILDHCQNISITFQPLLRNLTTETILIDYTAEQLDSIRELNQNPKIIFARRTEGYRGRMRHYLADGQEQIYTVDQFITEKKNNWKGWICWTGLEQLIVTQKGDVYRAWCLQDRIGHIAETLEFPTLPVICRKSRCHCNLDIQTRKQRPVLLNPGNMMQVLKIPSLETVQENVQ